MLSRYRNTHFVFSKWATRLDPFADLIHKALPTNRRTAPVELIGFPADADKYIAQDGAITIGPNDFELRRWG